MFWIKEAVFSRSMRFVGLQKSMLNGARKSTVKFKCHSYIVNEPKPRT